jgi:hypothetical protein
MTAAFPPLPKPLSIKPQLVCQPSCGFLFFNARKRQDLQGKTFKA